MNRLADSIAVLAFSLLALGCSSGGDDGGGSGSDLSGESVAAAGGGAEQATAAPEPSAAGGGGGGGGGPEPTTSDPEPEAPGGGGEEPTAPDPEPEAPDPEPEAPAGGAEEPTTPDPEPIPVSAGDAFDAASPSLGTNLSAVSYYSPAWVFVDVFKASRQNKAYPWDVVNPKGLPLPQLDAAGYPVGLGDGQAVTAICVRGQGGRYPAGDYTVAFDGDGAVSVSWDAADASLDSDGATTAVFQTKVTPTDSGIVVRIVRSNPANPVRNIRVVMPGFWETHQEQPFHPLFLERLRPFSVLRFMDWSETNNSDLSSWSERKLPGARTQFRGGVALEIIAGLSNALGKSPWMCVPHKADDTFVRQMAQLLKDELDPKLSVLVELSNETWNSGFSQYHDMAREGSGQGQEWYHVYGRRASEVFAIFDEVLGSERAVCVLATQAGNPWIGRKTLETMPNPERVDALAIAPYFGHRIGRDAAVAGWSVKQVLDACEASLPEQGLRIADYKAMATEYGVDLIAYEGGQHLVGVGSVVENADVSALFAAANRDPRMGQIYRDYLEMWRAGGGGLFCHFSECYRPQKWGSWGALEYQNQPSTPKYDALLDVAGAWKAPQ